MSARRRQPTPRRLSAGTGRTAAYNVREAVEHHLEELEDAHTLPAEVEASRRGESQSRSPAEVGTQLGLDETA